RDVDARRLIPPPHHLIHHEALTMKRRVLFLCTGNSARSVLAEATLRAWAGDRYEVSSAGSQPTGTVNPWALAQLGDEGIPTDGLRSKSWDEFATADAAPLDLVVTVCGSAAAETCPAVFGDFMRTHWGIHGAAAVEGEDAAKRDACREAHGSITARLQASLALPAALWHDRDALQHALDRIGG